MRFVRKMREEELNRHEEMSYVHDSEANEEILKNTVCKDELCRYLTPLKFLQINTWRKEVANGCKRESPDMERYKKWRTPVELYMFNVSHVNDDVENKQQSEAKKIHQKVKRQNEEVLRSRISTSQSKHRHRAEDSKHVIRPKIRQVMSAASNRNREMSPLRRETRFPSYSPDKFATVDYRLSSSSALMTSYLLPKKSSTLQRNKSNEFHNKNVISIKQSFESDQSNHEQLNMKRKLSDGHNIEGKENRNNDVQVFPIYKVTRERGKDASLQMFPNNIQSNRRRLTQDSGRLSTEGVSITSVNYGSFSTADSGICMPSLQPRQNLIKKTSEKSKIEVIRQINNKDFCENTARKDTHKPELNRRTRHIVGQTNDKRTMFDGKAHPLVSLDALDRVPLAHWSGKPSYYMKKSNGPKTVTFRLSATPSMAT